MNKKKPFQSISQAETFRLAGHIMVPFKLLVFFLILSLTKTHDLEEKQENEEFGIDETAKEDEKEFETKAHHTTGSFYYVLKNQPQTRRTNFVPPQAARPIWRPSKYQRARFF